MTFQKSLSIVCAAADLIDANLAIQYAPVSLTDATLGNRGISNISRPLSADGLPPATHYGAHTYDDGLLSLLEDTVTYNASFSMLDFYVKGDGTTMENGIGEYLTSLGLMVIAPPEE